jgi:hypothetical protein
MSDIVCAEHVKADAGRLVKRLRRFACPLTRCGRLNGQTGICSGPEVGFQEIAIDLLQARF